MDFISTICIVFALARESRPFRAGLERGRPFSKAPCSARFYTAPKHTILVVESGVGAERTERMLGWLLGRPGFEGKPYQPQLVISAGFCGALQPGYAVGDVVFATDVTDFAGNHWRVSWPDRRPECLGPTFHYGRILTAPHIIASPSEKRMLGLHHDAVAVDMETATIARRCAERRVAFGCVRAISDDVETALSPELLSVLAAGPANPLRMGVAIGRHTSLALEMWLLTRNTRTASRRLASALREAIVHQDGRAGLTYFNC